LRESAEGATKKFAKSGNYNVMMLNTWGSVLQTSFANLWTGVLMFIPNLIVAIIIVLIGWAIGAFISKIVAKFFDIIKLDDALNKAGFGNLVKKGGMNLNSGKFIGGLIEAFIIVAFLIASFNVLGLNQVTAFLQQVVLGFLPELIIAVLILLVGAVVGDVVGRIVTATSSTAGLTSSRVLGKVAKWAIWVFAILVALSQMGIAGGFIQTLFTGFVVAVSLALGLSFGLGGQEAASDVIKKIRSEVAHH
jgi:small-conductance mechanosensitive channel